ncbi:hypothetical protein K490DRAFT_37561 [Saccharata proteae CBS 121410]|uniref:Flavin-nucleotide-binding protein n=1 Tax=Saccharata proteae CBS 121410 TaxID=1314787 RepID=A0A6A5YF95_9PEZI|nr:hypothetical protein K490DRAFT_37561 [Saccharata proteae CBS 121410]
MNGEAYEKQPSTTFNRLKKRGTYDAEKIHNIINTTSVVHVSFSPLPGDRYPIILPMIGRIGHYPPSAESAPSCYLHGHVSSRLMKLGVAGGLPVCVAATKVDGFQLSLTPFSHSYNYRSAIIQGMASVVEDKAEKLWAMELMTDSVIPGRWANTRTPPDGGELQSTHVLKIDIQAASAKINANQAHDDKKDMRKEELLDRVWTGVVPVYETFGEPIPSAYNRVENVPSYIADFIRNENVNAEEHAVGGARTESH